MELTGENKVIFDALLAEITTKAKAFGENKMTKDEFNAQFLASMKSYDGDLSSKVIEAFGKKAEEVLAAYDLSNNESFHAMSQAFDTMKNISNSRGNDGKSPIQAAIEDNIEAINNLSSGSIKSADFEIKAAVGDMKTTNVGNYPSTPVVDNLTIGYGNVRKSGKEIVESVPSVSTENNTIIEMYESSQEGTPLYQGEGVAAPQVDYDYTPKLFNTQRVSAFTRISRKSIKVQAELARRLTRLVERDLYVKIAASMLAGNGTAPNISGMKTLGTAFSGAATGLEALIGTLTAASIIEILIAAETQMAKSNFACDKIYLNPTQVALMQVSALSATAEQNVSASIQRLLAKTIPSNSVTVGEFILVESDVMTNYFFENITVRMAQNDAADLKAGMVTVVTEADHALVVNPNDANGIVYGTFAAAATDLNS